MFVDRWRWFHLVDLFLKIIGEMYENKGDKKYMKKREKRSQ